MTDIDIRKKRLAIIGYEANVSGDIKYGPLSIIKRMSGRIVKPTPEFCFDFAVDKLDNKDIGTLAEMVFDSKPDVLVYAGYRDTYHDPAYNRVDFDALMIKELKRLNAEKGNPVHLMIVSSNPLLHKFAEKVGVDYATPDGTRPEPNHGQLDPHRNELPEDSLPN